MNNIVELNLLEVNAVAGGLDVNNYPVLFISGASPQERYGAELGLKIAHQMQRGKYRFMAAAAAVGTVLFSPTMVLFVVGAGVGLGAGYWFFRDGKKSK